MAIERLCGRSWVLVRFRDTRGSPYRTIFLGLQRWFRSVHAQKRFQRASKAAHRKVQHDLMVPQSLATLH